MPLPFENVREQLLVAGMAPRHVRRYVTELREHLADLAAQQRDAGLDSRQADERALALMGSEPQLVQAVLDQNTPRSLTARAPWSVLAVLPVGVLVAVVATTSIAMMQLLWPVREIAPGNMPAGYSNLIAGVGFFANYLLGPLLIAACMAIALRQRMTSGWVWFGMGLIALFSGFFGFHSHVIAWQGLDQGRLVFSAANVVYQQGVPDLALTLAVSLARAAVLFTLAALAYRMLRTRLMPMQA